MSLTALRVKNAKSGRHVDGRGLCLLVKPSGTRTWVLRMQRHGKRRDYGLGSALEVSLTQACEAASGLRRQVREGVDPVAERRSRARSRRVSNPQPAVKKVTNQSVASLPNAVTARAKAMAGPASPVDART